MIIGLGSDLTNMDRIAKSLERWGEKFEARCFTDVERAKAAKRPFTRVGTFAKRWAAKEAFAKAVGTGFSRGVFHKDIGVVNAPSGAPTLALAHGAAKRLAELTPEGKPRAVRGKREREKLQKLGPAPQLDLFAGG